jgi:hypothetical protein
MKSFSNEAIPARGIMPCPQEQPGSGTLHHKQISITVIENGCIALRQPFASIAEAKAILIETCTNKPGRARF